MSAPISNPEKSSSFYAAADQAEFDLDEADRGGGGIRGKLIRDEWNREAQREMNAAIAAAAAAPPVNPTFTGTPLAEVVATEAYFKENFGTREQS